MSVSRVLITLGVILVIVGLLWPYLHPLLQKVGFGRLPGDILVEREQSRFYFPITTSIIISLILTLLFWLFKK
ncbi:DUF2905 domain-containing protein [Kaarinaea lacus]